MKSTIIMQAPVFSISGYGKHSADIVTALWKSNKYNISVVPTGWGMTSITDNLPPDVFDILTFCCNNPIRQGTPFTFMHIGIPSEFRKVGVKNIGVTAGIEAAGMPSGWAEGCNRMDMVIVPSVFIRDLFVGNGVTVPVYAVGEGVDIDVYNPEVECKLDLKFETSFNFLGGGQWMQQVPGEDRKGIGLLLQLFCDTFADNKDVGLVLKTMTNNISSPDFFFTQNRIDQIKAGRTYPKIYLLHGDMSDSEMAELYNHPQIRAFVSATSGEGFGRMTAESIACDLPILVTGWSGHMDFIDKNLATLFNYKIDTVPRSVIASGLFESHMQWAYPDREDIKNRLRRCVNNYSIAKKRAVQLGDKFRKNWSKEQTDKKLIEVIDLVVSSMTGNIIQAPGIQMEQL